MHQIVSLPRHVTSCMKFKYTKKMKEHEPVTAQSKCGDGGCHKLGSATFSKKNDPTIYNTFGNISLFCYILLYPDSILL